MPTSLQSQYNPLSGFPSMETVCPSNLVEPLQTAFETLSSDIGDVDSYVLSKLGYSERKALDYLAAEQIDAIALAIWNIERGEGMIIGSQCVAGHTRIFDPITNTHTAIKELAAQKKPINVLSLSDKGLVPAIATSPFLKGIADLYRVVFDDGREITVTKHHRFLTSSGWQSISDGLREGHFLASAEDLPAYSSESCQLARHADALHSKDTAQDLMDDYSACSYPRDERPLWDLGIFQERLPLPIDALGHIPPLSHTGWRRIVSISFTGQAEFYDMHVPGFENYVAEGLINHNTGIGKGRIAAAIMRYALRNGRIPIFITDNTKLYKDIVRDLWDINSTGIQPLITDTNLLVELPDGTTYKTPAATKHNKVVRSIIEQDNLGEYNAIFCTYHQLKTIGNFKLRRDLLNRFIDRAILIMDESHVAGGTAASLYNKKGKDDEENRPPNRSEYARELVSKSQGTVWLSATYAKNSTVLGLYAQKTGIRHAVQSEEMLCHMIEQGGLPLQQALARKLVEAGQYIRHERSYEGIEFLQEVAEVSRDAAEAFSQIMRAIAEFDELKQPTIAELDDEVSEKGQRVHEKGKKDYGGVTSSNFTSIMWNVINQFLLAIKVDKVADYAIQQLKAEEKVVIALSNTMGSFISDYTEANGIEPGDGIDANVCDLLDKYLRRSREITITDPDPEIPSERRYITDAELTTEALVHYEQTRDLIAQLRETMSGVPISPIDWLLYRFQDAGFAVDEITGRGDRIQYDGIFGVYHRRTATERTPVANNRKIASFNGGGLDVLILNRSACTGVSLHASSKFSDQRKRHMVVAQAELNIDQVMQMLGRIHRTGQVVLPKFTFFSSNLPAEKRPGAILMKKMNSLSANTTANKDSEVDLNELDMLNQYGDRVVVQYLADNPDINEALLEPIEIGAKARSSEEEEEDIQKDAMKKVSGRIALLPIDNQEQFYAEVESRLTAAIETAKSKGTYSLEAEHMHLDAVLLRKLEAVPAKAAISPFAEAATLWQMEVNGGRLPRDTKEVLTIVRRFYDLPKTATAEEIKKAANLHKHKTHENFKERSAEYYAGKMTKFTNEMRASATLYQSAINKIDAMKIPDEDKVRKYKKVNDLRGGILEREETDLRDFQKSHQDSYRLLDKILSCITVGEPVQCRVGFEGGRENHYGVVIDVRRNLAYRNICNPNAWSFVIEFASRLRTISVHLGEVGNWLHIEKLLGMDSIEKHYGVFDQHQTPIREVREVFVGNLLGAYEVFKKGRFVSFDLRDGTTAQGLLMPKTFSGVKQLKELPVYFASPEDAVAFMSLTGYPLSTKDRKAEIRLQGGMLRINLLGQSKAFKMYWGNSGLLNVLDNEFVTGQSKTMIATTWRVEEAIAALMKINPLEALIGHDHARQVTGQKEIEFEEHEAANVIDLASYVKNKVSLVL